MITQEFTNLYGNTEVTNQNPDCNADYYLTEDQQRDHEYMQAKIYEAMQALADDPSATYQVISGGQVTDSGSGQVDIAAGVGIGKDVDGNLYLVSIPALTNVALPSGWNDDRQICVVGKYTRKLGASTRTHFIGETYHYSMADSYLGETDTDDLFVDSDPSATSLVWGSFKMNGTAFTDVPSGRSPQLITYPYPPGHFHGLEISNNVSDPTNDIDIAAGSARDDTDSVNIVLATGLTKKLDAAFAAGTNQGMLSTGSIADGTYHLWLWYNSTTRAVDVTADVSATSPTAPSGFTHKAYMWPFTRASGAIRAFTQRGEEFLYDATAADISVTNIGTSAVTRTMSVPTGVRVRAILYVSGFAGTSSTIYGLITSLDQDDETPSSTKMNCGTNVSGGIFGTELRVKTNTSAQVRSRFAGVGSDSTLQMYSAGFVYERRS